MFRQKDRCESFDLLCDLCLLVYPILLAATLYAVRPLFDVSSIIQCDEVNLHHAFQKFRLDKRVTFIR